MELRERKCADCNADMTQQDIERPQRKGYPLFAECCTVCANIRIAAWKRQRNQRGYQRLKQQPGTHEHHRKRLQGNSYKRNFGISPEEYEALFKMQGGVCASCGQPERMIDKRSGLPRALAVDHCHETGRIRALLCTSCNIAFGFLEENPERIRLLLAYAEKVKGA